MPNFPNPPGNDESHRFHMWVGYCIAAWSKVEDCLFQLCQSALNCDHKLAAIVYFNAPSVNARLGLVNELARSILPQRERKNGGQDHQAVKDWNAIVKDIRDLLSVRRRLAHQPVQMLPYAYDEPLRCNDPCNTPLNTVKYGVLHYTYPSDAESLWDTDAKPLYVEDLLIHFGSLEIIHEKLGRYYLDQFLPRLLEYQNRSTASPA